jgi:pantetheine-phosphate adenylyltransferase
VETHRLLRVAHHLAVFTGSFDPVTYGHLDVLQRARGLFDEIVIAVGHNPDKPGVFSFEERVDLLNELVGELVATHPRGAAVRVAHYTGLTVDFAREVGASAIIRGIRNVTDLNAECQAAITNRQVAGIETVFILTSEKYAYASSSLIRQIAAFGGSMDTLTPFVPDRVQLALRAKLDDPSNPLGRLRAEQAQD